MKTVTDLSPETRRLLRSLHAKYAAEKAKYDAVVSAEETVVQALRRERILARTGMDAAWDALGVYAREREITVELALAAVAAGDGE
jgi:hypothetical protein